MKDQNESTKVTLDLSKELSDEELQSFVEQAEKEGHSVQEHLREILFGVPSGQIAQKGDAA